MQDEQFRIGGKVDDVADDGSTNSPNLGSLETRPLPVPPKEQLPRAFGRYELRSLLGRGGMGSVYLAYDPQLDRQVALKMPRPLEGDASNWRERFLVEARSAATLQHPNICPVFEVGEIEGQSYLTMAFVEGQTLAQRVRQGRLEIAEAVHLVADISAAMGEAHGRGVIHRDLKPANIMLDQRGCPIIMDFGLAQRMVASDDLRLTLSGVAMGTPAYMPPEQAGGDHELMGPPSDVYALGIILNELVTGTTPFVGRTFGKLLAQIERDPPPPPSTLNPKVDASLESVILKCLEKAPADRFQNAADLSAALESWQQGERHTHTFQRRPKTDVALTAAWQPKKERVWGRGTKIALALAGCLFAGLLGVVLYVATDYGTLVVELSDPDANVQVKVNGNTVTLEDAGNTVRIRAGADQKLEISGPGYKSVSTSFELERGGRQLVRVTLVPEGTAGEATALVSPTEPAPAPQPPVVFPENATLVEAGDWQILTGATRAEMDAWLAERKADGQTVHWIDVGQIEDRPVFCGAASRQNDGPKWIAVTDFTFDEFNNPKNLGHGIDSENAILRSIAAYRNGTNVYVAGLFYEQVGNVGDTLGVTSKQMAEQYLANLEAQGFWPKLIRPLSSGKYVSLYAMLFETNLGNAITYGRNENAIQLSARIERSKQESRRPVSVVGYMNEGTLQYVTTFHQSVAHPSDTWDVTPNLTLEELQSQATAKAMRGLTPLSANVFGWDGALRYSVVWGKPDAAGPTPSADDAAVAPNNPAPSPLPPDLPRSSAP